MPRLGLQIYAPYSCQSWIKFSLLFFLWQKILLYFYTDRILERLVAQEDTLDIKMLQTAKTTDLALGRPLMPKIFGLYKFGSHIFYVRSVAKKFSFVHNQFHPVNQSLTKRLM